MKRVEVGVRKQEMWAEEKVSTRRRYLARGFVSARFIYSSRGGEFFWTRTLDKGLKDKGRKEWGLHVILAPEDFVNHV